MADNDNRPYVGYRSAGRRPESRNDRTAAANAPLNVLRGWAAGTLGLPGDIESLVRMLPGISEKNTLPTTEYFEERLPLRDMSPTGRAFTGLGTLTGGAGVATGAKAASRGAQALAPAAGALAMRAAELSGAPVYGMGVIKPKGGNWFAGTSSPERTAGLMVKANLPDPELLRIARENGVAIDESVAAGNEALTKWTNTQLKNYLKNEMATPEDPIRALAEKGRLHVDPESLNFRQELYGKYPLEGQELLGQSPTAKSWEGASDLAIGRNTAGEMLSYPHEVEKNPWLAKVPPETPVYGFGNPRSVGEDLGFNHLIDELRNAVNPNSGLPRELQIKPESLSRLSIPQAVERVADINEWRAAQKAEANAALANNAAAFTHKDYPDAPYKWVELKQPETEKITELPEGWRVLEDSNNGRKFHYVVNESGGTIPGSGFIGKTKEEAVANTIKGLNSSRETQALEDALKYEGETMGHCVGGYCPDVLEGRSRIFSLRNKKTGEPHVTIEVQPPAYDYPVSGEEFAMLPQETKDRYRAITAEWRKNNPDDPDVWKALAEAGVEPTPPMIKQIKGKANKAPKEEYLPFVQDFVRSGQWDRVGDLENAGLLDIGQFPKRQEALGSRFVTEKELTDYLDSFGDEHKKGFAEGGLVEPPLPAAEFSPLEMDYIIGNVTSAQHEPAYAEGGIVESNHIPYDEAKISSLVNALREELHA